MDGPYPIRVAVSTTWCSVTASCEVSQQSPSCTSLSPERLYAGRRCTSADGKLEMRDVVTSVFLSVDTYRAECRPGLVIDYFAQGSIQSVSVGKVYTVATGALVSDSTFVQSWDFERRPYGEGIFWSLDAANSSTANGCGRNAHPICAIRPQLRFTVVESVSPT